MKNKPKNNLESSTIFQCLTKLKNKMVKETIKMKRKLKIQYVKSMMVQCIKN